jgi:hypothetical protein
MLMTIAVILAVFWGLGLVSGTTFGSGIQMTCWPTRPRRSGPSGTAGSPNRYLRSGSRTMDLPGASGMKLWRPIPIFK